mmetsp:Transcript_11509/g.35189  ORF Transcript_11509/g.35189 Transcript_11509/m.35189 type:complete len:247 (-) Transcript_11509:1875-2615(-)
MEGGGLHYGLHLGTSAAAQTSGHTGEIHLRGQRRVPDAHTKNVLELVRAWRPTVHAVGEAARAQKGRIDEIGPVGAGHHEDVGVALHAVELGEQLAHDALVETARSAVLAAAARARHTERVQLVEEEQRRTELACAAEDAAQLLLGGAQVRREKFGSAHRDKAQLGAQLVSERLYGQRFADAGSSVQEYATRGIEAECSTALRMAKTPTDAVFESASHLIVTSHLCPAHWQRGRNSGVWSERRRRR